MKAKLSSIVLILSVFFIISETSYGCYNPPPTVYITYPTNGDAFTQSEDITVKAVASDDGYVTKVRFYVYQNGQQLTYSDDSDGPPYEHTWSGLTAGDYSLRAKACDNLGAWSLEFSTVNISVGQIRYVDTGAQGNNNGTSWANAFIYLQDALAVSSAGDEIRVAEGIYTPDSNLAEPNGTGDRTATFQLVCNVDVKGGYAGVGKPDPNERDISSYPTILSGDINDIGDSNDNSYHVVTGADAVVLDGFTITGGKADGLDANSYGGGMYNDGSSPIVINCVFSGNQAYDGGGMYNDGSSPTVINCAFSSNQAYEGGGGTYNTSCSPTIMNCVFSENNANDGGGIYDHNSCPRLTNCTLSGNSANNTTGYGGGIYNHNSYPTIINCIIWGNTAASDNSICNDNEDYNLDNGLVSWWKFDEGNGTIAYDSAGDNNGTLVNGPIWTTGQIDGALSFDGTNDYVTVGSPASLDDLPLNNMTVCAWIYDKNTSGTKWGTVAGCYAFNSGWSFRTFSNSGGDRSLYFQAPHSSGEYDKWATSWSSDGTIIPNTWHHVTAVWDGSTKTAKLYIDVLNHRIKLQIPE
jgi:hypothetical protein